MNAMQTLNSIQQSPVLKSEHSLDPNQILICQLKSKVDELTSKLNSTTNSCDAKIVENFDVNEETRAVNKETRACCKLWYSIFK